MAVIELAKQDFDHLLGEERSREQLEQDASMLGILWEDQDDHVEVEVEPNRPDLLSVEGVARALRGFFNIDPGFDTYEVEDGPGVLEAESSVNTVRPHIACAVVRDVTLNKRILESLIQLQEKLTKTFGRERAKVAVGIHDLDEVQFPFTYTAVKPTEVSFIPLEQEREMHLNQILAEHEKGQQYGSIVKQHETYPVIFDDNDQVLSFPPIINGQVTEVTIDSQDLFIDVTGTSKPEVEKALNIIVTAIAERGGTIETVSVNGKVFPDLTGGEAELDASYLQQVSGLDIDAGTAATLLEQMKYGIKNVEDGTVTVRVPSYRTDIMHQYDLIEDVVIAYGYNNVDPVLPGIPSTGVEDEFTVFTDMLRDTMVGAGADETCTPVLTNPAHMYTRMGINPEEREGEVVEMENPLTTEYTVMRTWLLPSLVAVLARNTHQRYPQKLFEIDRATTQDNRADTGVRDVTKLCYVHAGADVDFTDARAVLQTVAQHLGMELSVDEITHPSFADERAGRVFLNEDEVGIIGEVDQDVLSEWGITQTVAAVELNVEKLFNQFQD